jgi:hypothetical protein
MVGEHLSVDNMNRAIELASSEFNMCIPEFTVAGVPYGSFFAHQWYVASNDSVDSIRLARFIDEKLKELNDDYEVERRHALKDISVEVLPQNTFMNFMESKGKMGGQHKFPRVLKGKMLQEWQQFLLNQKKTITAAN